MDWYQESKKQTWITFHVKNQGRATAKNIHVKYRYGTPGDGDMNYGPTQWESIDELAPGSWKSISFTCPSTPIYCGGFAYAFPVQGEIVKNNNGFFGTT